MDGDGVLWYEPVDEDGVDLFLPESELNRPFVYRPTRLNEALIRFQTDYDQSWGKIENAVFKTVNVVFSAKDFVQSIPQYTFKQSFIGRLSENNLRGCTG